MSKVMVDPARIRNKNIKGCIICQNEAISNIVDPLIINAEMDLKTLKEHLQTHDFYIDQHTISAHTKHVFVEDIIQPPKPDTELELGEITLSSNLDIIKDTIASLIRLERKMMRDGKENTKEFFALLSEKRRLVEMKAKLEGELDAKENNVYVLPQYIEKLE